MKTKRAGCSYPPSLHGGNGQASSSPLPVQTQWLGEQQVSWLMVQPGLCFCPGNSGSGPAHLPQQFRTCLPTPPSSFSGWARLTNEWGLGLKARCLFSVSRHTIFVSPKHSNLAIMLVLECKVFYIAQLNFVKIAAVKFWKYHCSSEHAGQRCSARYLIEGSDGFHTIWHSFDPLFPCLSPPWGKESWNYCHLISWF